MAELKAEYQLSYAKLTFSRSELIEKLGFDPNDSFYVELVDYGRGGVKFTLDEGASLKYQAKEGGS